ncbi:MULTISPECIES: ribosomal L7Ae/L30e/S12e/Gadd45 family protein [unclassified Paenibacillus]|uniref:ribosomal L7Ae/L30e/S12e/Gadd45 family protein n=1 Tax=unclassified Paenibacillus TaxID=185978 RepID=UPI00104A5034|nr:MULTISPECIES: ribosomal L7Ae/L30e/S12e/Gadd45 family protein [unclassified Paenibacillus]NIK72276.1 large subunit ribosomal protein L7A [Paenibacillus sp. BK720]TCM87402.1 large subunit ribosomal protein L7A [Paenibacillus sp. BK033]
MQFKVGAKQTTKMLEQSKAIEVYVARDADPRMREKIVHLCERLSVPVKWIDTMQELGETCGIDVGAAMAALILDEE